MCMAMGPRQLMGPLNQSTSKDRSIRTFFQEVNAVNAMCEKNPDGTFRTEMSNRLKKRYAFA